MKAIIVDDEILARERISSLLKKAGEIEIVKECNNGKSAITAVNNLKPDLLFLDIDMKDMNGFQVLERIEVMPKPIVIFVTAHDEYAVKAFDFEAFDFLLKPFKEERFFKTVQKAINTAPINAEKNFELKLRNLLKLYDQERAAAPIQKIPVKQGNRTILIDIPEIKYIIASGYYAEIFVQEKKHLLRESLSNLISNLDGGTFIRIHRSTIININYIKEVIHSSYAEIDVKMKDDKVLRISKAHKKEFINKLGMANEK